MLINQGYPEATVHRFFAPAGAQERRRGGQAGGGAALLRLHQPQRHPAQQRHGGHRPLRRPARQASCGQAPLPRPRRRARPTSSSCSKTAARRCPSASASSAWPTSRGWSSWRSTRSSTPQRSPAGALTPITGEPLLAAIERESRPTARPAPLAAQVSPMKRMERPLAERPARPAAAAAGQGARCLRPRRRALLIVASDRLSAYDHVLRPGIPGKGEDPQPALELLVRASGRRGAANHLLATDPADFPAVAAAPTATCSAAAPCWRARRGWSPSSAWPAATSPAAASGSTGRAGTVCGIPLPPGLAAGEPPAGAGLHPRHQGREGHDENVNFAAVAGALGPELAATLRDLTLALYGRAPPTPPAAACSSPTPSSSSARRGRRASCC